MTAFTKPEWPTWVGKGIDMLWLSEVLMQHHEMTSFEELEKVIKEKARSGETFFSMDVRPPFPDTPESWETRLEAAFYTAN